MATEEAVKRGTGRTQAEWYELLDAWGAAGRPYKETAAFLMDEHGVSRWWAQKLIVEYEQDRGVREPGVRRNGTFEVSASKTIAVPATRLFEAFADPKQSRAWLGNGHLKLRDSSKPRSARFAWNGGSSRVTATFASKGRGKAVVVVSHERLSDARGAAEMKAFWRDRLGDLKEALESER